MTLSRRTVWLLTLSYAVIVGTIAFRHVVWRDEARALNIAMASHSIPELFQNLHNEGHPALWYLVLYAGFHLTHSTLVLKASSVAIGIGAVFVFVRWAPLSLGDKILFIFGGPVYQYAVYARNYGLTMLFLFLFGAVHKHRFEKPFIVALILGLLAHTHALGLVLAGALWCSLLVEFLIFRLTRDADKGQSSRALPAFLVAAIAMLASALQIMPDRTTVATPLYGLDAVTAARMTANAFLHPGELYATAFGLTNGVFLSFMILAVLIYLLRQPTLAAILLLVTIGFTMFFALVYPVQGYQKGLYLLVIVVLLCLDAENQPHRYPARLSRLIEAIGARKNTVLSLTLLMQVALTIRSAGVSLSAEESSSRKFGHYLRESATLREAIVMAEPGRFMESVHYYAPNEIYFPREGRFGTWIKFTTATKQTLSLQELLETAERVNCESHKPVVIAMANRLSPEGPFEEQGAFGWKFVYSTTSLDAWRARTTKIAEFRNATSDENYDVYRLIDECDGGSPGSGRRTAF